MRPGYGNLVRGTALVAVLVLLAAFGAWMLQASIPRRIVVACCADRNGLSQLIVPRLKKLPPGAICATERMSVNISCVYTSANGASS